MAQRKPEAEDNVTFDQVLKLVNKLTIDEQQQLIETLSKLQDIRASIDAGIAQLDNGLGIPAEEAFQRLSERYQDKV